MSILQALKRGVRRVRKGLRYIPLVYVIHLSMILIPLYLFFKPISRSLGHSPFANRLTGGADLSVLFDLSYQSSAELSSAFGALSVFFLLVVVSDMFLDGGIVSTFAGGEQDRKGGLFFQGCAEHFFPFLRLFGLFLVLSIPTFVIYKVLAWILSMVSKGASDEIFSLMVLALKGILILLGMGLINLVMDYAKISMVRSERKQASRHLRASLRFIRYRKGKTIALYGALSVLILLLHGIYLLLSDTLATETRSGLTLLILSQQLFILSRIAFRFLYFSAQGVLFTDLHRD